MIEIGSARTMSTPMFRRGLPNNYTLDLLVRHGAVVVGDKLCVTYHSPGTPVVIGGEVSLRLPSLAIATTNPIFSIVAISFSASSVRIAPA